VQRRHLVEDVLIKQRVARVPIELETLQPATAVIAKA
jgi:hypothetical protein